MSHTTGCGNIVDKEAHSSSSRFRQTWNTRLIPLFCFQHNTELFLFRQGSKGENGIPVKYNSFFIQLLIRIYVTVVLVTQIIIIIIFTSRI